MRQSYADHRERVICETQKPNIQLSHQIYQIELTIVGKYHHGGLLRKAILSAISSTCRPFIVLSKIPITGVKIYLVLAAQSSSPENKFNHCFFFPLLPFFSFPIFLLSISCSAVNVRGVASP